MGADDLGLDRLVAIDARSVWPHEARDFTPWLLANQDVLGDALGGMDLQLETAEHPVGGFSLDLLGRDLATGDTVIVENQLEATDHTHLGQILTYAGGTDPVNIVWVASSFREEHRAALDWLNTHTDERTRFFGVQVSVVRIGASAPAPLLKLVAEPNDWGKEVKRSTASATGRAAHWSPEEFDAALDEYCSPTAAEGIRALMEYFTHHPGFTNFYWGNGKTPSATLNCEPEQPWSVYTAPNNGTVFAVNLDWIYKQGRTGVTEQQMFALVDALTPLPGMAHRFDDAAQVGWRRRPNIPAEPLLAAEGAVEILKAAFSSVISASQEIS